MANLTELGLIARSSDPSNPANGESVVWMSDGTGTGSAGDILMKTTKADGTTKTINVTKFSTGSLAAGTLVNPTRNTIAGGSWTIGTFSTPSNTGPTFVSAAIDLTHAWTGASNDTFNYTLEARDASDQSDQHTLDTTDRNSETGITGSITDDWVPVTLAGWVPNGYEWAVVENTAADSSAENTATEWSFG